MPARVSRSSLATQTAAEPRRKNKSQKRSLNAFAIAEAEGADKPKIRRNRLGEVEDDSRRFKRRRLSNDEDDDSDENTAPRKRRATAEHESGESEVSDDDGNRWKMCVVEEDDDSDIDSEEAFGSSDEERFEGWTFRGGQTGAQSRRRRNQDQAGEEQLNLDEAEPHESETESLGSEAVDLATMLDNYEASDNEGTEQDSENGDEAEVEEAASSPSDSSDLDDGEDDQEEHDVDKASQLQDLVAQLHPAEKIAKRMREADYHESKVPSAAGVTASEKFDINDFLATTSDKQLKEVTKELGRLPKSSKKDLKLVPSLPKRQKDRLERIAANEKAKQTLERWVDTVKHQRRAEHLVFPLVNADAESVAKSSSIANMASSRPFNDLESTIHSIMVESGLSSGKRDEEEERFREFEELQANKLPLEEVQARQAQLRKARELLFREEVRAKRIKKIKSKSFRRIKRKEREKLAAMDRDAFAEDMDGEMDEEEREAMERKRAEERMKLKHKDSKWAREMKRSGRMTWDDSAVSGVSEMARKGEELRRRIEGKEIRDEDASGDEAVSDSEDEDNVSDVDGDVAELKSLNHQLDRAEAGAAMDTSASNLYGLKFMQRAEAARQQANQGLINEMRDEINGRVDKSYSEEEDANIGRKIFAPNARRKTSPEQAKPTRNEFEERDSEAEDDIKIITEAEQPSIDLPASSELMPRKAQKLSKQLDSKSSSIKAVSMQSDTFGNDSPRASTSKQHSRDKTQKNSATELLPGEKHSQPDDDGFVTVTYGAEEEEEEGQDEAENTPAYLDQTEILRRAFAGDNVEDEFEAEKKAAIEADDEKVIDTTLPGWGSWGGEGLNKKARKQRTPRSENLKRQEGIRPDKRKDAKLKNVIISQKQIKASQKYLATELPHLYGNKAEYERSIRMPIGNRWNTGQTYLENVKPRVIVKPGMIVRPMDKPLI